MTTQETAAEIEGLLAQLRTFDTTLGDSRTRYSRQIAVASKAQAITERLVAELIGESQGLADDDRLNWTEVGRVLFRLGRNGQPEQERLTRQGARQRYAALPTVAASRESKRLAKLQKQRDSVGSGFGYSTVETVAGAAGAQRQELVKGMGDRLESELKVLDTEILSTLERLNSARRELGWTALPPYVPEDPSRRRKRWATDLIRRVEEVERQRAQVQRRLAQARGDRRS